MDAEREPLFSAFVAENRDRAVGLAWRLIGGDSAAAEDVAQEAFVRAYRGLDRFREEAKFSTWFYRILLNEAHRYSRWRRIRERFTSEMPEDLIDPKGEAPGDPLVRRQVSRAILRLPRGQREAFVLVHLEGLAVRDAAEIAGKAAGTIKSHLHRAIKALRRSLKDLRPEQEATRL